MSPFRKYCLKKKKDFTQWCRSKSFPTFEPIGLVIETEIDPANLKIQANIDG